jgi:hypothetical protein
MNRSTWLRLALVAVLLALGASTTASAQENFQAVLRGAQETPANVSTGRGHLDLTISADGSSISYTLIYPSVPGGILQAHLHIGQPAVAGNIFLFLCTNLGNGPADAPACPNAPGQVSGTLTAADITATAASQGIAPGDMKAVLRAIRSGVAYANVHSNLYKPGEIRGQVLPK